MGEIEIRRLSKIAAAFAVTALLALAAVLLLSTDAPPTTVPAASNTEAPSPIDLSAFMPTPTVQPVSASATASVTQNAYPAPTSTPIATPTAVSNIAQRPPLDVGAFDLFSVDLSAAAHSGDVDVATVEEVLELGLRLAGASPTHIAFRGTADADSIRCDWRGIARTMAQREDAIRFWLDLDEDDPLLPPGEVARRFTDELERINAVYPATVKSNFHAIAMGGLSEEYLFLTCYIDYTVAEYLLGSGSTTSKQTVAYDRMGEARSYDLYVGSHEEGEFSEDRFMSEAEYEEYLDFLVSDMELVFATIMENSEAIVFLAPMGAHNAIAVEAWQAVAQWDVQRADDGTINAVRYGASQGDPDRTQTLANLKTRVTNATAPPDDDDASATSTPSRIPSLGGLTAYYRSIGAYGDITPNATSTDTFTPAQPPSKHVPPPSTVSVSKSGDNGASLTWSVAAGASGYQVQRRIEDEQTVWTLEGSAQSSTSHTVSDLLCSKAHEFRVGAYGNGTSHSDRVGLWSDAVTLTIGTCAALPPKFEADSYSFEIDSLASSGDVVGRVSAMDPNGDTVAYSFAELIPVSGQLPTSSVLITSGSEQVRLDIDPTSGELKLFGPARGLVDSTYDLTIGASDESGGIATVSASLSIAAPDCSSGAAVAQPESHHWLVRDCTILLAARDTLAGSAALNWSAERALADWDGISVSGTPIRVTEMDLRSESLSGTLPTALGRLSKLQRLRLAGNSLSGGLPPELGTLSHLTELTLGGNSLNGVIPAELGNLSKLTHLSLHGNRLTGDIPPELSNLSNLEWLRIFDGNTLTGCVPRSFGDVEDNDLSSTSLHFCNRAPEFGADAYVFSIAEDASVGGEVGAVSATDPEGDGVKYSIVSGNAGGEFAIDANTGTITLALALDYERTQAYALAVSADDDNHEGRATTTVSIAVTDVVDSPPAPRGMSVSYSDGTLSASWYPVTGADEYRLEYRALGLGSWTTLSTTTDAALTYAPTTPKLACGLTYELRVAAHGDGATHRTEWGAASETARVVTEACNRAPEFGKSHYDFIVLEGTRDVGVVSAADADGDAVSYSIESGNEDGKLTLTVKTNAAGERVAQLKAVSDFDYEEKSEYRILLSVSDGRRATTTASAAIRVWDVSPDPPDAVSGLMATTTSSSVTLSWDKPADPLITGYRITRRVAGSSAVHTVDIRGATTRHMDAGLSPNTKYIYRIHAIDYFRREGSVARIAITTLAPP